MISSISIGNFKAFAVIQKLPIKPITLIFGANSSGKSSILHSLLYATETLTQDKFDLDIHFTKIGGESVDLGGFKQFVNRRDASKNVLFGIELEIKKLSERLKEIFYDFKKINVFVDIGYNNDYFLPLNTHLRVLNFEIQTDEQTFFKMSLKEIGLAMDFIDVKNKIVKDLLEVIITSFTTSEKVSESDNISFEEGLNKVVPELISDYNKLIPSKILNLDKYSDPRKLPISPINKENRNEVLQEITINLIPFIVNDILFEISNTINEEFKKIEYLGPIRSYPERHFNFKKSNDNNWFAGGGHAWEVVANDKNVREKVNEWLGSEKMKTQYILDVIEMIPENILKNKLPDLIQDSNHGAVAKLILNSPEGLGESDSISLFAHEVFEELRDMYIDFGPFDSIEDFNENSKENTKEMFESIIEYNDWPNNELIISELSKFSNYDDKTKRWIEKFLEARSESISDVVLVDKNSNTNVSLRDVGIGISQVLPVLVSAFANKEKIITIEQPEIHLHPALQAELGDLFINSALGENKNSFILETHSEHLILRVLRRVRETTNNELKKGMCPIKPEDVQIVYLRSTDKGAEIVNLEINEEGDFKTKWPDGFFEERAEELF